MDILKISPLSVNNEFTILSQPGCAGEFNPKCVQADSNYYFKASNGVHLRSVTWPEIRWPFVYVRGSAQDEGTKLALDPRRYLQVVEAVAEYNKLVLGFGDPSHITEF